MLYIIVNNDYQLHALRRHGIKILRGKSDATLIMVPHAMSPLIDTDEFHTVHRFDSPVGRSGLIGILMRYRTLASEIVRKIRPNNCDTLLFFTEVEWLNQIIVQYFRRYGSHVVMLEDGGFATYIPMSFTRSEPLSARERCIQFAFRLLPGLNRSMFFKVNGQLFPRLPDDAIDVIATYHNVCLDRSIQTRQVLKPMRKRCYIKRGSVVFLNERMYDHYQSADTYLEGLRTIMRALTKGFTNVHFKFHPRESHCWKLRIFELMALEFPTVNIINTPGTIEEIILDYCPEVLASYFSAGLLSIEYEDIEPLYLFHLFDDLKNQPVFEKTTSILRTWGYQFARNFDEVCTGYHSGITENAPNVSIKLQDLILPFNVL